MSGASNGLTVISSSFSGNHVGHQSYGGGAIYNNGGLTVTSSTFSKNGGAGVGGGAIDLSLLCCTMSDQHYNSTLTITNSTFVGNKGSSGGVSLTTNPQ